MIVTLAFIALIGSLIYILLRNNDNRPDNC